MLTRAAFPMQPPELLQDDVADSEEMAKNPHKFQQLGVVALTAGQEAAYAAVASTARASGQSLREPYAAAYASLHARAPLVFLKPTASEAVVCPSQGFNSTWHACISRAANQSSAGFVKVRA